MLSPHYLLYILDLFYEQCSLRMPLVVIPTFPRYMVHVRHEATGPRKIQTLGCNP